MMEPLPAVSSSVGPLNGSPVCSYRAPDVEGGKGSMQYAAGLARRRGVLEREEVVLQRVR
jgi:hypothetical protein